MKSFLLTLLALAPCGVFADEPTSYELSATPAYYQHASLWSGIGGTQSWTNAVVSVIHSRIHDLETAHDLETFCPGYHHASDAKRDVCWLRLVGGIVEFESSFDPNEKPFYEGHGVYSVGLMALSTGECPNAPSMDDLKNPVKNLLCGVNKMADLIGRDRYIDSPDNLGAGAYWSTLRPAHRAQLPSGAWVTLGKKAQIIARTRQFIHF